MIVVAERVAPRFFDRIAEAYDLIEPHYGLDILIYTPEEYRSMRASENPLIERAEREGRVLYAIAPQDLRRPRLFQAAVA